MIIDAAAGTYGGRGANAVRKEERRCSVNASHLFDALESCDFMQRIAIGPVHLLVAAALYLNDRYRYFCAGTSRASGP